MPLLSLTLIVAGTALGGFIAALSSFQRPPAGKRARPKQKQRQAPSSSPAMQEPEDGDARLLRELQDDVELRLRKLRKLPPGELRRWARVC